MAVSPIIPNTVEVRLLWALTNNGGVNVLHATAAGGVTVNQALANTLGAAIKSAFTANLAPIFGAASGLIRVGVRDMRVANQTEFLDTGAAVVGTAVDDPLPPSLAACVTLRTALSGKSFRGRVYFSGFTEAENDNAGLTAGAASTACVTFMTAVSSAMTASQLTLAVASRPAERFVINKTVFHNDGTTTVSTIGQGNARAGVSTPVTVIQSRNNTWETQRRRTNGRGAPPTLFTAVATSIIG